MELAIIGTRGVPPNYSGFETLAWELGRRLATRGHSITVFGRRRWVGASGEAAPGVVARNLPTLPGKYFDTVSAAAMAALTAGRHDAALFVNAATAFAIPILRARHPMAVAINVDGFDWQRRKWGRLGRLWYRWGERFSVRNADAVVADADVVADYYRYRHPAARLWVIPYGSGVERRPDPGVLARYGLSHEGYCLYVSRFEAENNPDLVATSYLASGQRRPLVMLGRAAYDSALGRRMDELARDPRIVLLGGVYGDDYAALLSSAFAYIQATEVGGTHPALVEAMGAANLVLALDSPEHREVLSDTGRYFHTGEELATLLGGLEPADRSTWGDRAARRAHCHYSWEAVTDAYEAMFLELTTGGRSNRRRMHR